MVDPALLQQIVRLSAGDRRELFEAAQDALDPDLTAMIDEREEHTRRAPGAGRPWTDFRGELRERYGA